LPESLEYKKIDKRNQYVKSVFNDILIHDIFNRHPIDNVTSFENFTAFIMNNMAKRISLNKASNIIKETYKEHVSQLTLANYLLYLQESLLLYKIEYFSNSTKEVLKNLKRYYVTDHSMRNIFVGKSFYGYGRIIENIIYFELLRRGYEVKGFVIQNVASNDNHSDEKTSSREIDFICESESKSFNLQVCESLTEENHKSEIGNFKYVNNGYPNYLMTLQPLSEYVDGVKVINIFD
jgi:predicted AAA+ superfamily ATPase